MADFPAEQPIFAGTLMTERSGATAGTDTVPINCVLLCRNTGAGAHNVIIKVTASYEGLTVPDRTVALTAGQAKSINIPGDIGDANGRVGISVDTGTIAELKYHVFGDLIWLLSGPPTRRTRSSGTTGSAHTTPATPSTRWSLRATAGGSTRTTWTRPA